MRYYSFHFSYFSDSGMTLRAPVVVEAEPIPMPTSPHIRLSRLTMSFGYGLVSIVFLLTRAAN